MKRSRLSYDEWKCILSKELTGRSVSTDFLQGYVGLIRINEVSEPQIWQFKGQNIIVCDKGLKWLSILPRDDFYCITAMLNEQDDVLLWYIDMIAEQGMDSDGVPYFDDLYLDLVVYPDGTIMIDDMDELEDALSQKDITQEQFDLAIHTSNMLQAGMLSNIENFTRYTQKCLEMVSENVKGYTGKKSPSIHTERLELKPYTDKDCEAMISMLCNEEIKKTFMIPDFATKEDAVRMFHKLKEWSESDEHFEYGIYLHGQLIGFVNDVETDQESMEVGYVIHPDMQNQGYATEMLNAVITELFRIGYTTVRAGLFEENAASRRVMEKCGMIKMEHEEDIEYQGKMHHCIYYEKSRIN